MSSSEIKSSSFYQPQEAEWHRMIAEAAYYLAQRRGFAGVHSLDDWLAAERQVREAISPILVSEVNMNRTGQNQSKTEAKAPNEANEKKAPSRPDPHANDGAAGPGTWQPQAVSRFEKFATTQAAGDGVEGDVLKPDKTVDEKLGANMADRK
jgi:Protein of unknown function (DUF2934)